MNLQPLTLAPVPLQFSDSMSCRRWVEQLTLSNAHRVHEVLTSQLSSLTTAELPPVERLKILETLRETVHFVQGETAKRYAGKGLPLDPAELNAWSKVIALWQEAHNNYGQCLKAYREGDLSIAPHAALVTMRCLRLTGDTLTDYYRSYRQPPGRLWRSLHELYSFAEQQGFARIRVQDSFGRREADSSCAEVYVQVVLGYLANPFSLSIRQMGFVERWVERWATMVGLAVQEPPASAIPLLAVDLNSERGPSFAAHLSADANPRYLELEQLSKTMRQTISLLKQGQTPAQLGLGDDARQPGCENLLMLLYLQWCRAGTGRDEERSPHEEAADVCFGLASAHGQLTTRPARTELSSREKQDLDTYGYVPRVNWEVDAAEPESSLERWLIVNQSVSGFMCIQREPTSRIRVHHNELIAVRRANGRHFHLGMAQWLKMDDNGVLCCGIRLFPGTPQAISVRPSNFNPVGGGRHERALLLPEVPAPSVPASIVLPAGWFQSGRFVEVYSDRKQVAKLLSVLEKGLDFDRGTIVIV